MKTKNLFLTICIATFSFALLPLYSSAQAPNYQWAKSAGASYQDIANSTTTDASGNIYVVGNFKSSSVTFGSITLTNANAYSDIFIVKYDALGNTLWAKNSSGVYDDEAYSVTTDATGNIIVSGYFSGTSITFGSITLTGTAGNRDMFIVKYDVSGNVLWAKSAGGGGKEEAKSVATDANGNILVVGIFNSPTITFGSFTLTTIYTTWSNIFVVKYNASGNVLWAKSSGGSNNGGADIPNSVTTDANGNVFMAGIFNSPTITFGSFTLTNTGAGSGPGLPDIFVVKYDASGNVLWAKSAGGSNGDEAYSISTDANGNSYVVGYFLSPTTTFGSITLTKSGSNFMDLFIVKYDAAGNVLWAKNAVGSTGGDVAHSISTDANGNSYVVGYFRSSTITFGSATLNNANPNNTEDIFIAKYDASGNALWAKSAGGTDYDRASSVTTDANGNIIMVGYFGSPNITFGSNTLNNANPNNTEDIFIAKLNSATGIESLENTTGVNIYPNPSNGKYIIEMENVKGQVDEGMIEIYNVMGEIIYNTAFQQLENTTIDISEKPNGIYFLTIISDQGKRTIKILKY